MTVNNGSSQLGQIMKANKSSVIKKLDELVSQAQASVEEPASLKPTARSRSTERQTLNLDAGPKPYIHPSNDDQESDDAVVAADDAAVEGAGDSYYLDDAVFDGDVQEQMKLLIDDVITFIEECDPKVEIIDRLLKFEPTAQHEKMAKHYATMGLDHLKDLLKNVEQEFGPLDSIDPEKHFQEAIMVAVNDPRRQEILFQYEASRQSQIRVMHELRRQTGVVATSVDDLLQDNYHERTKKALDEAFILKKTVGDFLRTTGLAKNVDFDTVPGILFGLKHLFTYYRSAQEKNDRMLKQSLADQAAKDKSDRIAREARETLSKTSAEFSARITEIQGSMVPIKSKVYIGRKGYGSYLADRHYAKQVAAAKYEDGADWTKIKHSKNILHTDLVWVSDPDCAMKFNDAEKARTMLEMILEAAFRGAKAEDVRVAGAALVEISIMVPVMVQLNSDLNLF